MRSADPQTLTEVGTKLDLARAYIDMGDPDGARSILEEVLSEGDTTQRSEAQSLIQTISA
jgi:pilus assembly protein FimV